MNLSPQLLNLTLGAVWLLNAFAFPLSSVAAPASSRNQPQRNQPRRTQPSGGWVNRSGDPPPYGPGKRNPCDGDVVPLVPIFEQGEKKERNYVGYTSQALPTFRFSVPYNPENIESSEFVLRYPGGSVRTTVKIAAPGIIQVSLPSNKIKELTVGQWYVAELQVKATCRSDLPKQLVTAGFSVKRRNLSMPLPSNLTNQQKIDFYRNEQMWFEALDIAIKLKCDKPNNQDWQELLSSAGLEEQSNQRVLECSPLPSSPTK